MSFRVMGWGGDGEGRVMGDGGGWGVMGGEGGRERGRLGVWEVRG